MSDLADGAARVIGALDELGAEYTIVRTAPASSAEESAELQGIELRQLLKTIVVRKTNTDLVFVLVPGDRAIDWRKLRAHLGVGRASLPTRDEAQRITGYGVGAITPFGSLARLPVVIDSAALEQDVVALGGGERGVNVHLAPDRLLDLLEATAADVTAGRRG